MNNGYHQSVLLQESISGLNIVPDGVYVDVTFGGGGHSMAILERLSDRGRLFAFDQDADAQSNLIDDPRFVFIPQNFKYIRRYLRFYGVAEVDGVLADFGVSSHQFDEPSRGFSTRFNARLDMRMNQRLPNTASDVLNTYSEQDLSRIFFEYGELKNARQIAKAIVISREITPIIHSEDFKNILSPFLVKMRENRMLAQVYQALRIEVNQEIEALQMFLTELPQVIKTGGRLSVISYHSLEDRCVKRFIRDGNFKGEPERDFYGNTKVFFKRVGQVITPSEQELKQNNRARSAKLRIAERL